jgi:hypothetical protein
VNRVPLPIEWLSDNGSPYTARETRALTRPLRVEDRHGPPLFGVEQFVEMRVPAVHTRRADRFDFLLWQFGGTDEEQRADARRGVHQDLPREGDALAQRTSQNAARFLGLYPDRRAVLLTLAASCGFPTPPCLLEGLGIVQFGRDNPFVSRGWK